MMNNLTVAQYNIMGEAESIVAASVVIKPLLIEEREAAVTRLSHKFQAGDSNHQTEVAMIVAINNVIKKMESYQKKYQSLKERQHGQ